MGLSLGLGFRLGWALFHSLMKSLVAKPRLCPLGSGQGGNIDFLCPIHLVPGPKIPLLQKEHHYSQTQVPSPHPAPMDDSLLTPTPR